jgi:protein gp37
MADKSKIEWTQSDDGTSGATWNPVTGCEKVSPGCDHCYAETFAERWRGTPGHYFEHGFDVQLRPDKLDQPLRWKSPRRIFVNSMSDLFHDDVPDEYIARVFAVMAVAQQHTFQVLTKRHARMRSLMSNPTFADTMLDYLFEVPGGEQAKDEQAKDEQRVPWPLPNVWLGVSAEDQHWADIRIPALLNTPAAVRFVSAEPLLGPINLSSWLGDSNGSALESRGRRIPGRGDGRVDHRRAGACLEGGCTPGGPVEWRDAGDSMPATTGGEAPGEVSPGAGDVRRGADPRAGSPAGVEALQWADPTRLDGESQERRPGGELATELGARDLRGADGPRANGSAPGSARSIRGPERRGETHHGAGAGDLLSQSGRRAADTDRGGLRDRDADRFEDRAGRPSISWLIVGGESGPGARRMAEGWARNLVDECVETGTPVFVKQLGSVLGRQIGAGPKGGDWEAWPEDLRVRQFPRAVAAVTP